MCPKGQTISDNVDSGGWGLVVLPYETFTQHLATEFIRKVISVWGERVPLLFAPTERAIQLAQQSYMHTFRNTNKSGQS